MIRKVFWKLRSRGVRGLLQDVFRRVCHTKLKCWPHYKSFFESRIGLEIGGPSCIFRPDNLLPVYQVAGRIDNCNFSTQTIWEGAVSEGDTFIYNSRKSPGHQYVAEASDLSSINSGSYDFVLSSHCIEHMANPLQGLSEWIRVLKNTGLLVLIIPHKDGTFDHCRPVTSLEHLIEDMDAKIDEGDLTHLEEILKLHDLKHDPGAGDRQSFIRRSKLNAENRCLHHHVFDTRLAVEVVNYMGLQLLTVEVVMPHHIVLIARKSTDDKPWSNERFRGLSTEPCWCSSFPSDKRNDLKLVQ